MQASKAPGYSSDESTSKSFDDPSISTPSTSPLLASTRLSDQKQCRRLGRNDCIEKRERVWFLSDKANDQASPHQHSACSKWIQASPSAMRHASQLLNGPHDRLPALPVLHSLDLQIDHENGPGARKTWVRTPYPR